MTTTPRCKYLVLDSGPLLSLSPLRGLADTYLTVPQVLSELKDSRAREHFERLGLNAGVHIEVRNPDPRSLLHVIQFSKKTGDYSVLSQADLAVLALTHTLHERQKQETEKDGSTESGVEGSGHVDSLADDLSKVSIEPAANPPTDTPPSTLDSNCPVQSEAPIADNDQSEKEDETEEPLYEDPSDSDDGEGEWITPANVSFHKSRAMDLLPHDDQDKKSHSNDTIPIGCMTADFAMQNVLLQMGLNLVSTEGKRIEKVKSWVLRCHACFKICKDNSKKFCPSCGNPTLLRASVTIASPTATDATPVMQVHLKRNFQYKLRGTKYSIPAPKSGSAKAGSGEGLILREDQIEYQRAVKRAEGKRAREEQKMVKGIFDLGSEGGIQGSWADPDWIPEIISVGAGGKGRSRVGGPGDGIPEIGYGRKNPNERRRRKK